MSTVIDMTAAKKVSGPYKVDVARGGHSGALSSQWHSRPDDQRFLTLEDLYDHVASRRECSWAASVECQAVKVKAQMDNPTGLALELQDGRLLTPNHWSFGQLARQVGAPPSYLRTLPAPLAGINLQHGLQTYRGEISKFYATDVDQGTELRAVTSPTYGRIHDAEVVDAVMRTAGDDWKVPGVLNWTTGMYDPNAPVSKRSTTLYASDRDVFVFLCRDNHPIEVGKLRDGSPDYLFPGFLAYNSETGSKSFGLETMFMRAICQNRNLWGVEQHSKLRLVHSKGAPDRFLEQAHPQLEYFANMAIAPIVSKVGAAKATIVAREDDDRKQFLTDRGFSKRQTKDILETVLGQDNKAAESIWDFCQGITAYARDIPHQDARIDVERIAGRLMDKVSA
jgi:hypothetical protein